MRTGFGFSGFGISTMPVGLVNPAGPPPPPPPASYLLLSGDMTGGTDKLLLSGDMQSGTDKLLLSGT